MSYIILDTFNPDHISVVGDDEGKTLYFDTNKEAVDHAQGMQAFLVVEF